MTELSLFNDLTLFEIVFIQSTRGVRTQEGEVVLVVSNIPTDSCTGSDSSSVFFITGCDDASAALS